MKLSRDASFLVIPCPPLQVLFALLFSCHPFVPDAQISSGQSCIMIAIENSMKGEMIMPYHAQDVSPGVMDLLKKVTP